MHGDTNKARSFATRSSAPDMSARRHRTRIRLRASDVETGGRIGYLALLEILEGSRNRCLFTAAAANLRGGTDLKLTYHRPLHLDDRGVDVTLWCDRVRASDFMVHYEVRPADAAADLPAAAAAATQLVVYDGDTIRPMTTVERRHLCSGPTLASDQP